MKTAILITTVLLLMVPATFAQGRGGGGGQGQRQGQGSGQAQSRQGSAQGQGTMNRTQQIQRDRLRTQATDQQKQQYATCDQSMDRLRTQARDMSRVSSSNFSTDQARLQRDQLREQIRTMDQDRERIMQSLNGEQSAAVQQQTRTMQETQARINTRLQNMNQELEKGSPDGKRVATEARNIERDMVQYQKQYRQFGQDLSLQN